MPGKQHEIWFHEKLVNKGDTSDFRVNRAEDWTRLQVLDGNTFKPAMDQGFGGMPSSEQMENLYKLAEQGKLVFFAHGEEIPFAATTGGLIKIDMNPVEPVKPVEPGPNVSRNKYETELQRYPRRMEIYKAAKEVLEKLGDGFQDALNNYNNTRNMEAEQTEGKSRAATVQNAHELHRLENTDRFINDVFGPRPVASPGYFFDAVQNGTNDFVFSYETFDRQFAPNGYDLPENSKLTAQEVATINFAITFGIAGIVWSHKISNRIGAELSRRGIAYNFSATDYWLWNVLGCLIFVGPFIYMHKLFTAVNKMNAHYNVNG